jgi:hypothetical protein
MPCSLAAELLLLLAPSYCIYELLRYTNGNSGRMKFRKMLLETVSGLIAVPHLLLK